MATPKWGPGPNKVDRGSALAVLAALICAVLGSPGSVVAQDAGVPESGAAADDPTGGAEIDAEASREDPEPTGDDEEAPELDPDELAAIEAALAADADDVDGGDGNARAPAAEEGDGTDDTHDDDLADVLARFNLELGFVLDVSVAGFSDADAAMQTGAHDPVDDGFNFQQLELSVGASVDPYFRVDGNLVFGLFGVEVEEFYGTTLDLPGGLQARAGQFLTRFGRINAMHPHRWDFVDQPFSIGRIFGGEGNRGPGLELSWLTPLPWYVELVVSSTMAGGEATNRSFFGASDLDVESPLDLLYVTSIDQFFALGDDWSLYWGVSGAFGPNGTGRDNRTEVYGTDVYLKYRPISRQSETVVALTTEWMYRRRQVPGDSLWDVDGYAQLLWQIDRRWETAARYELGTAARGTSTDQRGDDLDPSWTSARHRVAASFTYRPTEFSRLRFQVSVDVPTWLDTPIYSGVLALELSAGAHGAHEF